MEITEIRIKLMEGSEDRLRAFCSITLDQSFVVRDLKIIDGTNGPFVAMPSRKLTANCGRCGFKNHLRAQFCNQCGGKLSGAAHASDAPQKLYADVAHPINSECRERIQRAVIDEFQLELTRASQPGYSSRYDDDFDAGDYDAADYQPSSDPAGIKPEPRGGPPVPRPHFKDQRGSARDTRVKVAPVNQPDSRRARPTEEPDSGDDAFGAGIF